MLCEGNSDLVVRVDSSRVRPLPMSHAARKASTSAKNCVVFLLGRGLQLQVVVFPPSFVQNIESEFCVLHQPAARRLKNRTAVRAFRQLFILLDMFSPRTVVGMKQLMCALSQDTTETQSLDCLEFTPERRHSVPRRAESAQPASRVSTVQSCASSRELRCKRRQRAQDMQRRIAEIRQKYAQDEAEMAAKHEQARLEAVQFEAASARHRQELQEQQHQAAMRQQQLEAEQAEWSAMADIGRERHQAMVRAIENSQQLMELSHQLEIGILQDDDVFHPDDEEEDEEAATKILIQKVIVQHFSFIPPL